MSDDQWKAPGREHSTPDGGAGQPYPPPGTRGGPGARSPYAPPPADVGAGGRVAPDGGAPDPDAPHADGPRAPYSPSTDAFAMSDRHRERVLGGEGYDSPAYRNDSVAVTAMVLAVVGVPVPGVSLFAVAFGHLALRRLRTSYEGGRGLAVAALVLGYVMTAIWLAALLLFLTGRSLT